MSSTYTVRAGDTEHTIEGKAINLLCHRDEMNIQVVDPDVMEIDPISTVARARAMSQEDWDSIRQLEPFTTPFSKVFKDLPAPVRLQGEGMGVQHIVGMIILLYEAIAAGKRPFLRTPESYLHPASQSGIADMLIWFSKPQTVDKA